MRDRVGPFYAKASFFAKASKDRSEDRTLTLNLLLNPFPRRVRVRGNAISLKS